jgi:hypothetical protein
MTVLPLNHTEEVAARRLYRCNWIMLSLMGVSLIVGMMITGFSIAPASALTPLTIVSAYLGYTLYRYYRPGTSDPKITFILGATGQLLIIPVLMTPLTYIAAAANLPMQDVALNAFDRALGLDWIAYFNFVYHHHALLFTTVLAYSMIGWPVFGVPLVLGWTGKYRRMQEFTLAFGIALVATTIISTLLPAMGTYALLDFIPDPNIFTPGAYLEQLRDLPLVRDGSLRTLDFNALAGIITFPSFHAAAAVLYLWAFLPVRWIGPVALVVNVAMLLATPICGGHYFVDVFAGIATAVLAIMAARRISNRLVRPVATNTSYLPETAVPAG